MKKLLHWYFKSLAGDRDVTSGDVFWGILLIWFYIPAALIVWIAIKIYSFVDYYFQKIATWVNSK